MSNDIKQSVSKKGIWGWMLFDWAAQPFHTLILTFIFAPYFTSQVANNDIIGQSYWGYAIGITGILIALLSPILGALADTTGPRKPWIFGFAIIGCIASFCLWYIPPQADTSTMIWGLIAIGFALLGFEFSAVFNNAMMPDLVPREELGKLSGSSWALGYIGGLFCLVLMLGFMVGDTETGKTLLGFSPIFGLDSASSEGDRASGPLTAIWLAIFIIPLLLFTPDKSRVTSHSGAIRKSLTSLKNTLRSLPKQKSLTSFLLSSMLYRDALNGLYAFGGIYAAGILQWSIIQIGIFGIVANIAGAVGAWFGGKMDARFGSKTVVTYCVWLLIFASVIIVSTDQQHVLWLNVADEAGQTNLPNIVFYLCGAIIGAAGGSLQASSRTLMVDQADPNKMGEAFGLYALSGRATSFIAPISIAFFTSLFASQRIGITPVIGLFVLSLFLLPMVHSRLTK
ncbi:MFS transporter [Leucothrix arctica]|uniref:MFS transporter n=1 Tax=Leucothrix arctica TaxID=1481894 RepID=A0A317CDY5_9GAMM|nr:MFS transporter [Leucothrix arctica]PWQ96321.1 MFS transporter [Leucothrix arctica]